MILTDKIHVTSDSSLAELHDWAKANGISRSRYHGYNKHHPHYDLTIKLRTHDFDPKEVRVVRPREILKAANFIWYLDHSTWG